MSVSADGDGDPITWHSERTPVARKEHKCIACRERILPGHRYHRWTGGTDYRDIYSEVRCLRCQKIYAHLRDLCSDYNRDVEAAFLSGDLDPRVPAPSLNCGLKYEDEWGACPDEIAALAFALPGEVES